MRHILDGAIFLILTTACAQANPCDGIWQKDKAQGLALLKPFLTKAAITRQPAKAKVYDHMQSGDWDMVWASLADAESGGFVIHGGKLVESWGGVAAGDTASDLADWMQKRHKDMPRALAACFGWCVAEGRETKAAWPNPFRQ